MTEKINLAIDALAAAAFIEGGVSPEKSQAARDLTDQRKRELVSVISAPCLHHIQEPSPVLEAPKLDEAWKARMLDGQPLLRDKDGIGFHPALPDFDEGTKCADFFAALGIELKGGMAENEMDSDAYEAMTGNGLTDANDNYNAWTPMRPEGEGWNLVAVFDTEDGPACWWMREMPLVPQRSEGYRERVDNAAVEVLSMNMKAKLAGQRAKGFRGWNNDCTQQRLSDLLRECVEKGDPVDVANFCAFLLSRGETIAPQAAPAAVVVPKDWMEHLGFELDAEADGIWQVIEDTGERREATLTERVLWKELTAICASLAATPEAAPVDKSPEVQGSVVDKAANLQGSAAVAVPDELRTTLIDVIAQGLSGTWHCNRVWEAWHVGTMSQEDFSPVEESDTPTELADAVLAALAATPAAAPAVPKWIDDPHDIEQGQMLNPEWVKAQEAAAAPAAVAGSAPCTFMTADQARDWAWNKVREDVGTEGWTVMDSVNYYGFYMWGWNYRAQYELQRTATRSAVIQEILSAAPAAAAPVVLPEPVAYLHECGKKPSLRSLEFSKVALQLSAKGYKAIPLYTEQQLRSLLATGGLPRQPHCLTCNDHGAVGNILTAEPCPDCTVPAIKAQAEARDAWPKHGDLVRYASGSTALALHGEPHAGGWHGVQCMGGHTFYTKTQKPSAEDRVMWVKCAVRYRGRTMDEARIEAGLSPIAAIEAAKGE